MTDISSFPTIKNVVKGDSGTIINGKAGETISAGQVVGIAATGVSDTYVAMDETTGERPIGVAIFDATSGDRLSIASFGCIAKVANADDTSAIDAGSLVETNDNSVKGTVSEVSPRADLASAVIDATNDTTIDGHHNVIGMALEDIAGDSEGYILVAPQLILYSDHAVVE
jgi:hypothetical protein